MKRPIVAIMYDFDKTLCTKDMQEYGFIPSIGQSPREFWGAVAKLTDEEHMDNILAYMYEMVRAAANPDNKKSISRDSLQLLGKDVAYYEGVETWFERVNKFAESKGVNVEHYIVSSGVKEIIEGTSIANQFKRIYASEFMYRGGKIVWPKFAVNYTAKTQFLFRINKGVLDISTQSAEVMNQYTAEKDRRIPFRNMIYIGDGLTDVPCMKLVRANGGQSIAVYTPENGLARVKSLLSAQRVNYIAPADYSERSDIESIVFAIIRKVKAEADMLSYQG